MTESIGLLILKKVFIIIIISNKKYIIAPNVTTHANIKNSNSKSIFEIPSLFFYEFIY